VPSRSAFFVSGELIICSINLMSISTQAGDASGREAIFYKKEISLHLSVLEVCSLDALSCCDFCVCRHS
jgi:hypothetical protein